jgi:hypothetical protein
MGRRDFCLASSRGVSVSPDTVLNDIIHIFQTFRHNDGNPQAVIFGLGNLIQDYETDRG